MFHGDPQTQAVFFWTGKNANGRLAYVTDWNNHDVRTEGMSYGMMISVQLNQEKRIRRVVELGQDLHVHQRPESSVVWILFVVVQDRWHSERRNRRARRRRILCDVVVFCRQPMGQRQGIYDYKREADELLTNMRHRAEKTGPTKFGMRTVAAEVNEEAKMIRFVPVDQVRRLHRSFVSSAGVL